jgi:TolA-binding protein
MIASAFRTSTAVLLAALMLTFSAPTVAFAQSDASVTPVDIQRLQDRVFSLSSDLSRLRSRDSSTASRLEGDLDDLRDEVVYLRVKLRKEGRVQRSEYADLRDRLDSLGSRIRGDGSGSGASTSSGSSSRDGYNPGTTSTTTRSNNETERQPQVGYGTPGTVSADPSTPDQNRSPERTSRAGSSSDGSYSRRGGREIPVGQELDIRLQTPLSSETAQVEDRFEATTIVDMYEGNQLLVPAGSVLRGVVSSVKKAGRVERKGVLTLSFDQITVDGRDYPIRATVTQAIESSGVRGEAGKIGTGAGVGAIIGGILGGFKGALAGILIGGGGTIAATEGTDVKLDAGTILRLRFDSPVALERSSSSR